MSDKPFVLDKRIDSSCITLTDWPLSRVLLKNNADYPWFILVPRVDNIQEMGQLPQPLGHQLMDEISQLSSLVRSLCKPDRLNVAALGNMVSQLHVHVVARFIDDKLWPHAIWQEAQTTTPYDPAALESLKSNFLSYLTLK